MGTVHIAQSQNVVFSASMANTRWVIDPGVTIASTSDFCFYSNVANTEVVLRGTLDHDSDAGSALALWQAGGGVTIATQGKILGLANGVFLQNTGQFAVNRGLIDCNMGMFLQGTDAEVENFGKILGDNMSGIRVTSSASQILNSDGALIRGADGINTMNAIGATTRVENHGTIKGTDWAFDGGSGVDIIINRGKLVGSVALGNGQNIFDNRGGTVTGDVAGGANGDTYLIDDHVSIFEGDGGGYDILKTKVSYVLDGNNEIEVLTAIGEESIDLTANEIDNRLNGNSGNNVLKGMAGDDWLDGGRGSDLLFGGAGADHLVFKKGGGNDVIKGFDPGEDLLYVENFYLDNGYDELMDHAKKIDGDLVITFGKDSVTIKGLGALAESDVTFADL